jgi:hypothetical protein
MAQLAALKALQQLKSGRTASFAQGEPPCWLN